MSTPITLSGFNSIDFNSILNLLMEQERQPVTLLESQKTTVDAQKSAFSTLASKLSSLGSAASSLRYQTAFDGTTSSVSDSSRLSVTSSGTAPVGMYEVYVDAVARSHVVTSSAVADSDNTVVAHAGTLKVGTHDVAVSGDVTLQGLADAINATDDVGVTAGVIHNSTGYHLMLTSQDTGADQQFSVTDASGISTLTYAAAQTAQDAKIRLNGVEVTSSTNTFDGAIPGVSFTAMKQDQQNPVVVTITASNESLKSLVQTLVTAFNDTVKFLSSQQAASVAGQTNNIGRDPLARSLRATMTQALTGALTNGGTFQSLAEVGFSITRTGELSLDSTKFSAALTDHKADVVALFSGTSGSGVFGRLGDAIDKFTDAGGLIPNAQKRLTEQSAKISSRIADMEDRLAIKRAALQKQFTAADQAIAQLNQSSSQISQMNSSLSTIY